MICQINWLVKAFWQLWGVFTQYLFFLMWQKMEMIAAVMSLHRVLQLMERKLMFWFHIEYILYSLYHSIHYFILYSEKCGVTCSDLLFKPFSLASDLMKLCGEGKTRNKVVQWCLLFLRLVFQFSLCNSSLFSSFLLRLAGGPPLRWSCCMQTATPPWTFRLQISPARCCL